MPAPATQTQPGPSLPDTRPRVPIDQVRIPKELEDVIVLPSRYVDLLRQFRATEGYLALARGTTARGRKWFPIKELVELVNKSQRGLGLIDLPVLTERTVMQMAAVLPSAVFLAVQAEHRPPQLCVCIGMTPGAGDAPIFVPKSSAGEFRDALLARVASEYAVFLASRPDVDRRAVGWHSSFDLEQRCPEIEPIQPPGDMERALRIYNQRVAARLKAPLDRPGDLPEEGPAVLLTQEEIRRRFPDPAFWTMTVSHLSSIARKQDQRAALAAEMTDQATGLPKRVIREMSSVARYAFNSTKKGSITLAKMLKDISTADNAKLSYTEAKQSFEQILKEAPALFHLKNGLVKRGPEPSARAQIPPDSPPDLSAFLKYCDKRLD